MSGPQYMQPHVEEITEGTHGVHVISHALDPNGLTYSDTNPFPVLETSDYLTMVTRGLIPGQRIMRGLGEREGAGNKAEDITRMNELTSQGSGTAPTSHILVPTPPEAGELMTIVSESNSDKVGGSGATMLGIDYITPSGGEATTTIALNGRTPVNIPVVLMRYIQDIYVTELGSSNTTGVAKGPIKIYSTADAGLVYNMIAADGNMSMVPHKMVPAGKTLHLRMWVPAEAQGRRTAIRLRSDCTNASPPIRQAGVFLFKSVFYANKTSPGDIILAYTIPEFSIIKASIFGDQTAADASVHWWGILIDD